jgi:hypothetical protein
MMNKLTNSTRRSFMKKFLLFATVAFIVFPACISENIYSQPAEPVNIKYVTVAALKDRFLGWPANNGMWHWDNGREILVGFTNGNFEEQDGHNIGDERLTNLARSTDGGETWTREDPENFVGDVGEVKPSPGNIRFGHTDFALRVAATGYHGTRDKDGRFFISYDRGKNWEGPYRFNELNEDDNLEGMQITSRTNYRITGENSIQIFMSARRKDIEFGNRLDKPFIAESTDGGRSFQFKGWAIPWTDQFRAVMPSVVQAGNGDLVMAVRRRNPRDNEQSCWIDAFVSKDGGRSWSFLSKIGDAGLNNGNPPGLAILEDGRMACCYANRTSSKILLQISENNGASWNREIVVRDNPHSYDMGYPQLLQNNQGDLVALYYIATEESPQSYIEAAIISGL